MKPNFIKTYPTIPLLKMKVWEEIKTFAQEEYQQLAIIKCFKRDFYDLISEARGGITDNNTPLLLQSLHTLKGIAGTIGATRLQFITKEAEGMTRIDSAFIDEIEQCGRVSIDALNNHCG
ncbi:Hpt domain-containing protein [Flammeovirga aprica]|uniref:Hpt domain-containing protein n=1 Tax=Flammeovirga aprica JL-4 TaxID=694437 RepID=A0A7X9P3N3_9BACT|nr:Hpt domain-containing protein [Flammeovirga aprica]NME67902.1 Hpt domain-containing protein [Flammeovirga aprica JL-4]